MGRWNVRDLPILTIFNRINSPTKFEAWPTWMFHNLEWFGLTYKNTCLHSTIKGEDGHEKLLIMMHSSWQWKNWSIGQLHVLSSVFTAEGSIFEGLVSSFDSLIWGHFYDLFLRKVGSRSSCPGWGKKNKCFKIYRIKIRRRYYFSADFSPKWINGRGKSFL